MNRYAHITFRITLVIVLARIIFLPTATAAQSTEELFSLANQAYEKGQYNQAELQYELIISRNVINTEVFYNLGNACFKKGSIAKAILYYEKARKLSPRDRDINQNLKYALDQTVDKIETTNKSLFITITRSIHNYLTLNEWTITLVFIFNLLCLGVFLRMVLFSHILRDLTFYVMVILVFLFMLTAIFFTVKVNTTLFTERGVVMTSQVEVRSGPSTTYTTLLRIHSGTRTEIIQYRKDWLQIKLENGYQGWVPQSSLEKI